MIYPMSKLETIDALLTSWRNENQRPREVHQAIKDILKELSEDTFAQDSYVKEKLSTLTWHLNSILGVSNGNGHSSKQHHFWAVGDLNKLKIMAMHPQEVATV